MRHKTVFASLLGLLVAAQTPAFAGFLGVQLAEEIPEAVLSHLEITGGAMVLNVVPGSPAQAAGLRRHDVIIGVGEKRVDSGESLRKTLGKREVGATVKLHVCRGAKKMRIAVRLGVPGGGPVPAKPKTPGFLGVQFDSVSPILAHHLRLEANKGVVISQVLKGSPAEKAGLKKWDIVVKVAGGEVTAPHRSTTGIQNVFPGGCPGVLETLPKAQGHYRAKIHPVDPILRLKASKASKSGEKPTRVRVKTIVVGGDGDGDGKEPARILRVESGKNGLRERIVVIADIDDDGEVDEITGINENIIIETLEDQLPGVSLGWSTAGPSPTASNLPAIVAKHFAGDTVKVEFIRRGKRGVAAVVLGERPADHTPPPIPLPNVEQFRLHLSQPGATRHFFGFPHAKTQGTIRWRDAEGKDHTIELPFGNDSRENPSIKPLHMLKKLRAEKVPESAIKELEKAIKELEKEIEGLHGDETKPEVRRSFRFKIDPNSHGEAKPRKAKRKTSSKATSKSVSEVCTNDGTYEIRIRNADGKRTVSVKKNGKTVATDTPWKQLDSLPEDVRKRVRKLDSGAKTGKTGKIETRIELDATGLDLNAIIDQAKEIELRLELDLETAEKHLERATQEIENVEKRLEETQPQIIEKLKKLEEPKIKVLDESAKDNAIKS
jgi:hypothetical protein